MDEAGFQKELCSKEAQKMISRFLMHLEPTNHPCVKKCEGAYHVYVSLISKKPQNSFRKSLSSKSAKKGF